MYVRRVGCKRKALPCLEVVRWNGRAACPCEQCARRCAVDGGSARSSGRAGPVRRDVSVCRAVSSRVSPSVLCLCLAPAAGVPRAPPAAPKPPCTSHGSAHAMCAPSPAMPIDVTRLHKIRPQLFWRRVLYFMTWVMAHAPLTHRNSHIYHFRFVLCSVLGFGPVPTPPTPLFQGAPVRLFAPKGAPPLDPVGWKPTELATALLYGVRPLYCSCALPILS